MEIKVISDTHGYLPEIGSFDLLLICGDICPIECHKVGYQGYWIEEDFVNWINGLDFKDEDSKVVMTPGNHDFFFEKAAKETIDGIEAKTNGRLKILINEEYETHGLKLYGCPFCKEFGRWAFMRDNEALSVIYDKIPEGLDILLTHDAPDINELGLIKEGKWAGENAGNKVLAEYIEKKKPKYAFCGHIHSGNHDLFEYNGIKFANVSYVNEYYYETDRIFRMEL